MFASAHWMHSLSVSSDGLMHLDFCIKVLLYSIKLATGEQIAAFCLTEPSSGSDAAVSNFAIFPFN